METVKVRIMMEEDIPAIATIIASNYSDDWGQRAIPELREMFSEAVIRPIYYVATLEDEVVGVAGLMQSWMDYNVFQIFWVNVSPSHQKLGIGRLLVNRLIEVTKEDNTAYLIQLTTDSPEYYSRHFGFKVVDTFMGVKRDDVLSFDYALMTLRIK